MTERVTPVKILQQHTGDVAVHLVFHFVGPGREEKKPGGDKVVGLLNSVVSSTLHNTHDVHTYEGMSSSRLLSRDGRGHQEIWSHGCGKWNQEGVTLHRFYIVNLFSGLSAYV